MSILAEEPLRASSDSDNESFSAVLHGLGVSKFAKIVKSCSRWAGIATDEIFLVRI